MIARLAMPGDRDAIRDLVAAGVAESEADLGFDEEAFGRAFHDASGGGRLAGYVAEGREGVVGFALCGVEGFFFASGVSSVLHVIYVTPAKRGTRAAALLLREFLLWSRRIGARRMYFGINNGLHPDRTARFFERAGARRVGHILVL